MDTSRRLHLENLKEEESEDQNMQRVKALVTVRHSLQGVRSFANQRSFSSQPNYASDVDTQEQVI